MLFSLSVRCFGQNAATHYPKTDLPPASEIWYSAVTQDSQGEWHYLKGAAQVRTSEILITADEIDFNSDTAWAYARGRVHMEQFSTGEIFNAEHGEYNLRTEEGKFYVVQGTAPSKMIANHGTLTTTNPFYYQGQWADRIRDRMILHKGFVTDCKMPNPWWKLQAPVFDIVPGQRALARHSLFRLHNIPILYMPYFRRPLGKNARQSGLLSPTIGHSTVRGYLYGIGYYWAINRSYDLSYDFVDSTQRGTAHAFEYRGKPNTKSDFDLNFFGVKDPGYYPPNSTTLTKQSGYQIDATARTALFGFSGVLNLHYIDSYAFSVAFANYFSANLISTGFLQRHFDRDIYSLSFVFNRNQTYENYSVNGAQVVIQKLPMAEVSARSRQIIKDLPVWFSFTGSAGLISRSEPVVDTGSALIQTGAMGRSDLRPTVATAFSFKGFSLYPSVSFDATDYTKQLSGTPDTAAAIAAKNLFRDFTDFVVDFRLPSLERTFTPVKWLHLGNKLRHVIEPEVQYEYLTGVHNFQRMIRFDGTDIVADTNQVTASLTNRIYKKDKNGDVKELLTWKLRYAKYFDHTFGGAVKSGQDNVILTQELLTPYTFLEGPRSYSPIVSAMSFNPYGFFGIDYQTAYDPRYKKFIDHAINAAFHYSKYFLLAGDTAVTPGFLTNNPYLTAATNQLFLRAGYGDNNRRGLNLAAQASYDVDKDKLASSLYQVSYNTDCCGFSVQLRRISYLFRDENQYLFSFSVANIGSIGTLQRQARIF